MFYSVVTLEIIIIINFPLLLPLLVCFVLRKKEIKFLRSERCSDFRVLRSPNLASNSSEIGGIMPALADSGDSFQLELALAVGRLVLPFLVKLLPALS